MEQSGKTSFLNIREFIQYTQEEFEIFENPKTFNTKNFKYLRKQNLSLMAFKIFQDATILQATLKILAINVLYLFWNASYAL